MVVDLILWFDFMITTLIRFVITSQFAEAVLFLIRRQSEGNTEVIGWIWSKKIVFCKIGNGIRHNSYSLTYYIFKWDSSQ